MAVLTQGAAVCTSCLLLVSVIQDAPVIAALLLQNLSLLLQD
jgi:hypothetical protein